jgi:rhodanese-related sulfurtransferase
MSRVLLVAARQAVVIVVIVVVGSVAFNLLRKDGIPLIADAETFRVQTDAEFIKVDDAYRLFEQGSAVFVDARDRKVFAEGHIEGAVNLMPSGQGYEDLAWISSADTYVVCYASSENQRQAGTVADRLIEMGSNRVRVLYGGFDVWKSKGFPVQTGGG